MTRTMRPFDMNVPPDERKQMGKVLLEMSVSLDGYTAGAGVSPDSPMGRGGERLHEWMFTGKRRP